jgi:hypothetical protein
MVTTLSRKARLGLMLLGSLLALTLGLITGPASAEAATSTYCTGWQGAWGNCAGAARTLYQTYGWGDQAPVCVSVGGWGYRCSSAAGAGVYSDRVPFNWYNTPNIVNNSGKTNFVHGVALQP